MSEELQNDIVEDLDTGLEAVDEDEGGNVDHDDNGSDLAPEDNGDEGEQPESAEAKAEAKQAAIQKTINAKHAQTKQAERERDAALARVEVFEQAQRDHMAAQVANIPDYPNEYDENFQGKLKERDEALLRQAAYNNQQQQFDQHRQQQAVAQQQKQVLATQEAAANYNARALELEIPSNVLQAAGQAVAGMGVGEDVVMHILGHPDGPLITKYLADNPMDAIDLASMNPLTQGSFLGQVHAKALAKSPVKKKSKTPAPGSDISGTGGKTDRGAYPNSRGASFS